ncbi:MAG: hypothetical protein ACLFR1_14510 [Spirochaetia bacterium]
MSEVKVLEENGKQIVYMEFPESGAMDEIDQVISEGKGIIHSSDPESVLALSNIKFQDPNPDIMKAIEGFTKSNKPYIKKSAVIGISGVKKALVNAIAGITGRNMKVCSSKEEAIDYLTKDS